MAGAVQGTAFRWAAPRCVLKVCCIASLAEAETAVRAGATALGLVAKMPSGPGTISEDLIAEIAASVPPPIATFLLTSHTEPAPIILQHRRCRTNTIQLTDALPAEAYPVLRAELPGVKLVQVIHVAGADALEEARAVAPHVDALLLDSGNPKLQVKELGGTGRVHDWQVSRRIVETVSRPVFLAGGLNPQNVGAAVAMVRPFGVDVCSGLRTAGRLDEAILAAFADVLAGAQPGRGTEI